MRVASIIVLLISSSTSVFSQQYHKFKVGLGLGPVREVHSFPVAYVEPSYRIRDNWSVGLRYETASTGAFGRQSFGLSGQYYPLKTNKFRPFIGMGFSLYSISNHASVIDTEPIYEKEKPGVYPRVGFDYGHLSIMIDYNFMTPFKGTKSGPLYPAPEISYVDANYFAFKVGFTIGGGKRNK